MNRTNGSGRIQVKLNYPAMSQYPAESDCPPFFLLKSDSPAICHTASGNTITAAYKIPKLLRKQQAPPPPPFGDLI